VRITPDDLLAEAGRLALELRFRERAFDVLEADVAAMRAEVKHLRGELADLRAETQIITMPDAAALLRNT
jgi:hypothetical protein